MQSWKRFEKEVAKFFGGQRRVRVRYDESIGDVIHPDYSLECKYGGQVPAYLNPIIPTLLKVTCDESYWVVPNKFLEANGDLLSINTVCWVHKTHRHPKFLWKAMEQAKKYNPTLTPIVCVKPRSRHGFVAVWRCYAKS